MLRRPPVSNKTKLNISTHKQVPVQSSAPVIQKDTPKLTIAEKMELKRKQLSEQPTSNPTAVAKISRVKSKMSSDIQDTERLLNTPRFTESQHMSAYADIFYKLREIIALQEERCLYSEKTTNIYALMQLYTQLRDTIHDIRSVSDFTELSNTLVRNIIRPMLSDIGQNMIDIASYLKKDARESMDVASFKRYQNNVDTYTMEFGKFLKQSYDRANDQVNVAFKTKK